jgi:hypothetical protein
MEPFDENEFVMGSIQFSANPSETDWASDLETHAAMETTLSVDEEQCRGRLLRNVNPAERLDQIAGAEFVRASRPTVALEAMVSPHHHMIHFRCVGIIYSNTYSTKRTQLMSTSV